MTNGTNRTKSLSPAIAAWSGARSCAGSRRDGFTNLLERDRAEARSDEREQAVENFFATEKPAIVVVGRGQGRRDQGEQRCAGRVSAREFADPEQRHPRRARTRRAQTSFSRQFLHLSETCAAADPGRRACSTARSNRRTKPTPSPRLPASNFARLTRASTARISSRAMPTNLYGPNDNFDLLSSHVLAALLRKGARSKDQRRARAWSSGVRANRGANFCMSMIWPRPAFSCSRNTTRPRSSMSVAAKTSPSANWPN